MNRKEILEIFKRFQHQNPHPTTELKFRTPFELLIAVMLAAQSTDKGVNKATPTLFAKANTPEAMYKLGEEKLKKYIKTIGLYHTKAKNIIKTCEMLIRLHQGEVPHTREELEALPGVGRKTANVILNTIFHQPTVAVDTHIFRVANRVGLTHATTPLATEMQLLKVIPKKFMLDAHHWLVLHGRYVCVARKPHCPGCIINDICEYPNKTVEEVLP